MLLSYNESDSSMFHRDFYRRQVGNGLSVYRGKVNAMQGQGIGSFLSGMLKKAAPVCKKSDQTRRQAALVNRGTSSFRHDKCENVGASLKKIFKETGTGLLQDVLGNVSTLATATGGAPSAKRHKKAKRAKKKDLF